MEASDSGATGSNMTAVERRDEKMAQSMSGDDVRDPLADSVATDANTLVASTATVLGPGAHGAADAPKENDPQSTATSSNLKSGLEKSTISTSSGSPVTTTGVDGLPSTISAPAAIGLPRKPPPIADEEKSPVSPVSKARTSTTTNRPRPGPAPFSAPTLGAASARFRASVRKVIQMHRTSSHFSGQTLVGAEPGIDVRRASAFANYGNVKEECAIEVLEYSRTSVHGTRMGNDEFITWLNANVKKGDEVKSEIDNSWVKVRWINIGGISWDVMSALAIKYELHPLALEDILQPLSKTSRSKADYYAKHLFIRILRHCYIPDDEADEQLPEMMRDRRRSGRGNMTDLPLRSSSPEQMSRIRSLNQPSVRRGDFEKKKQGYEDGTESDDERTTSSSRKNTMGKSSIVRVTPGFKPGVRGGAGAASFPLQHIERRFTDRSVRKAEVKQMMVQKLKNRDRVNVDVSPMFLFLFRDGTVISISPHTNLDFTEPISGRVRKRDTGLRTSADASLLLQSLLDLVVDRALDLVDEFQKKILKLEHQVLIKPQVHTVQNLHILSGDLTLHKRTLEPIKSLIYGLRRYDVDRCAALYNSENQTSGAPIPLKIEGYLSSKTKTYLADVFDHMEYILSSIDLFSSITENLISYTFNMQSYEMNEVMRRLTLVTIICLPLTLLTGYFGMNFTPFPAVNNHTDLYFWEIAIPLMAVVIPLFMWSDIVRAVHYLKKRWAARRVSKAVRGRRA